MAVTDLTNTKWVINSTTCTAGYGQFDVIFNANSQQGGELTDLYMLGIGYSSTKQGAVATANTIALGSSLSNVVVGDTIEFLRGTDVTNANLITWLEANATQQVEPAHSDLLEIYSNDNRATHYKIYANGTLVATIPRVVAPQSGNELTVLSAPATQSGNEVTLG